MPWKDSELIACVSKITRKLNISTNITRKLDITPELFEDILAQLGATPRLETALNDSTQLPITPEQRYRAVLTTIEQRLAVPLSHISPSSLTTFDNENLGNLIEILDVLVNQLNLLTLPSAEELAKVKQTEERTVEGAVEEFPAIENVDEDMFMTPRRKCLRALLGECMKTQSRQRFRPALKVKHVQIAPQIQTHDSSDQSLLKPHYRPLIRPPKTPNKT
ncbi:hypothetical protein Ciccas_012261, partial [Cichlidogyrus casuarinus]